MPTSVTMPALGESVTEGTVTQWLKKEGDTVEVDEPLLEVSTDKVDTEVPSPVAGVLLKIVAAEDAEVEIGGELAIIGDPSESAGSAPAEPAPDQEPLPEPEAAPAEAPAAEAASAPEAQAAPAAGGAEGTEVLLPELGESVTEGTVTTWLKAVGDTVEVDEPLLEISTDKVDTEIPSPAAGTLLEIRVDEDETTEVGSVLAIIGSGAAAPAAAPASAPTPAVKSEPEPEPAPVQAESTPTKPAPAEPETAPAPAVPHRLLRLRPRHLPRLGVRVEAFGFVRDAAGAQARLGEQRGPRRGQRFGCGRTHPQGGRPGRHRVEEGT